MQETNIKLSNRKNLRTLVKDQKGALSIQWMVLIVGLIGIALAVGAAVLEAAESAAKDNVANEIDSNTQLQRPATP